MYPLFMMDGFTVFMAVACIVSFMVIAFFITIFVIIASFIVIIVSSNNYVPNSDATKLGPSPAAPSWPGTREHTCRTHACRVSCWRPPLSAHVFLRVRIPTLP